MKSNFGPVSYSEIVPPPVVDNARFSGLSASRGHKDQDTSLLNTRAGLPATRAPPGTSEVTTLAAATTAPLLIVTPGKTVTPVPIQTLSPMCTGFDFDRGIPSMVRSWPLKSRMLTFQAMAQFDPMLMWSMHVSVELGLI